MRIARLRALTQFYIEYSFFDEAEVIRNILSLGSSVVVLEPLVLQKKIHERIIKAANMYGAS